ncbi:PREDICTED: uncharacterized protein LOC104813214 isoform X2 [Tarenaya hassleriana]|uniref:uncharacterized protein LOC104813214 isoform X2 n=1 Tax=Tarenaya hassleriana TaxID=28532 RepID=UPI00053C56D1|nr:PREDICTED: uncharacterized protein LOC104813214 isoform X2 [Tarenaya hassleriana]
MPSRNGCFSSHSSSSLSSSSSSSQLSTPRGFHNGVLQSLVSPRLSTQTKSFVKKSPLWNPEKANCQDRHSTTPKSTEELRNEIAELETEILHLERYLLSLYRTTFGDHLPALLPQVTEANPKCPKTPPLTVKFQSTRASSVSDTSVSCRRSLSSSFKPSSETEGIKRTESGHRSLADLLGVSHMIEDLNTPNRLSEEILRSVCLIYCKFSDKTQIGCPKSPCHSCSQQSGETEGETGEEFAVVVHKLCLDEDDLKSLESMLQKFRSLVRKLEKVDPRTMTREQKLAFWINVHNALLMHAYIAYGTSKPARDAAILKAAYNVGGECISAHHIQNSILGICPRQSAPRLQTMFSPARKSKTCHSKHAYALDYTEPLVHFALSSGTSTDPAVRVYTAKGIFQELKRAREEFIRRNIQFENEARILLPKILYNYAKDSSLDMDGLLDSIAGCLPDTQQKAMRRIVKGRQERCVRWLNQDPSFRYVIHGNLA